MQEERLICQCLMICIDNTYTINVNVCEDGSKYYTLLDMSTFNETNNEEDIQEVNRWDLADFLELLDQKGINLDEKKKNTLINY